jgi:hypothetical protein
MACERDAEAREEARPSAAHHHVHLLIQCHGAKHLVNVVGTQAQRLGINPSRTQKRYDDRHLSEHGGKDKQKEAPRHYQKNYENTKRIFTFEVIKKEAVILPSY